MFVKKYTHMTKWISVGRDKVIPVEPIEFDANFIQRTIDALEGKEDKDWVLEQLKAKLENRKRAICLKEENGKLSPIMPDVYINRNIILK